MNQRLLRVATLLVLAAGFCCLPAFAEEASAALPSPAADLAAAGAPAAEAAAPCDSAARELPWQQPNVLDVTGGSGCKALAYCQHGGTVSCSSVLAGTCSSSGSGCGVVSCNGVVTRCPGYCSGDQHCFNFCDGSPDAYCVNGCCDCG